VRQGLKDAHNWPTFPQVYAQGKLIGGVDIIAELIEGGELASVIPAEAKSAPAAEATKAKAGHGVTMAPAVAGIAAPPAPAGYGGGGAATAATSGTEGPVSEEVAARLRALVSRSPAMLFMKGTPSDPACGFSDRIVQLLRRHQVPFESFDILTDATVRAGLKTLFDWPTFPQLYVHGSLVGGLDIVKEMADTDPHEPLATKLGL